MGLFGNKNNLLITKERYSFLNDHFYELSFKDEEPNRRVFDTIDKPEELYLLAHFHNWDDGTQLLEWIIDSPLCDEGTAKLVFWRAQPDYYQEFDSEEEAGWDKDVYSLLRNILKKIEENQFKTAYLHYDPKKDEGAPNDLSDNPNAKWKIPPFMRNETKGKNIIVK